MRAYRETVTERTRMPDAMRAPRGSRFRRLGHELVEFFRDLTQRSPARFAIMIFLSLILVFTGLFSLPIAAADGRVTPFADAFFTAVSTVCVTGLATVDMATHWSPFGHVLVFLGVQIGALGVLTLASILGLVISRRLGLRAKLIAASDSNPLRTHGGPVNEGQTVQLGQIGALLATVALSTLVIEGIVAAMLFPGLLFAGVPWQAALWEAPFYAAMAFTNTGFTPNAEGLAPFSHDYFFLTALMAGVFLGSIGFPVIYTLRRHLWHVRRWSLHAKLTIITTVALFFAGGLVFLVLEYDNLLTLGNAGLLRHDLPGVLPVCHDEVRRILDPRHRRAQSVEPPRRVHAHVRRRRLRVDGGRHQGHDPRRHRPRRVVGGEGARIQPGVRPPHPERRPARGPLGRRLGIDDRRTVDDHHHADHEGGPRGRALRRHLGLRHGRACRRGSPPSSRTPPSTSWRITIIMGRVGTVTLAAAVAASSRSQLYSLPVERPIVG